MEREGAEERVGDWWRINNARRDANLAKWLVGHEATGSKATATANATGEKSHPFISGSSNTDSDGNSDASRDTDSDSDSES